MLEAVCPGAPQHMAVQAEALAGEVLDRHVMLRLPIVPVPVLSCLGTLNVFPDLAPICIFRKLNYRKLKGMSLQSNND